MTQTEPAAAVAASTPEAPTEDEATRAFSTSIAVSAVRCLLTYILFPWLLPLVGIAKGIGPGVGIAVGLIAVASNIYSIRRFHGSDHRWKWHITALNGAIIAMLAILLVIDVRDLLG